MKHAEECGQDYIDDLRARDREAAVDAWREDPDAVGIKCARRGCLKRATVEADGEAYCGEHARAIAERKAGRITRVTEGR